MTAAFNDVRAKVKGFLKRLGMDPDGIDIGTHVGFFLEEMERGLEGAPSSLQMIPTYIEAEPEIPSDTPVIVIDAGGTNFRAAVVRFTAEGAPVIERFSRRPMPGTEGEVSKDEFFDLVAGSIEGLLGEASDIGFCFSYPTEILPDHDGRLVRFVKQVKAKQVEGALIGQCLLEAIRARGHGGARRVVILNDTVATLLAGRAAFADRAFDGYVGFILGTGTNCCYIEKNLNVKKKPGLDPDRHQIINVESGGFSRAPRGSVDLELDGATVDPGSYPFEKMISGAYFGPLCLGMFHAAAGEGLLSGPCALELKKLPALQTHEVNEFLLYPDGKRDRAAVKENPLVLVARRGSGDDLETLFHVVDGLIERAAVLTAVNLSSMVLKSGRGQNPCFPLCITAEGSTFHGLKGLKAKVCFHLTRYLTGARGRYYEIAGVENATLIGAAIAGLTN